MTTGKKSKRVTTEYTQHIKAIVISPMSKNKVFVQTVQMWCFEECMNTSVDCK